jgi:hypothetical protein
MDERNDHCTAGDCKAICREGIIPTVAANIVRAIIKNLAPAWLQGIDDWQRKLL